MFVHQPNRTKKGSQNNVNCMLISIASAFAKDRGVSSFLIKAIFRKNIIATIPSPLNETRGNRTTPNHLVVCQDDFYARTMKIYSFVI